MQGGQAAEKEAVLMAVCSRSFRTGRTIVFFRTKQAAHRVKMLFGLAGLPPASELHGNMTQAARLDALEKFRKVAPLAVARSLRGAYCFVSKAYIAENVFRIMLAGGFVVLSHVSLEFRWGVVGTFSSLSGRVRSILEEKMFENWKRV
jgi:hypothetical protein